LPPSEAEIQDGRSKNDSGLDPEERLDGHSRPKRCLFVSASGPRASAVPQVSLERRLEQCTLSTYQTSQVTSRDTVIFSTTELSDQLGTQQIEYLGLLTDLLSLTLSLSEEKVRGIVKCSWIINQGRISVLESFPD